MNTIAALIMGAAAAALVTALLGLAIIPWLRKLHFGQTILEIGPKWHEKKQGTPTMGGLMFIFGTIAAVAVTVITDKLLGGDIVDEGTELAEMQAAISALGAIESEFGVYYVFGNHDRAPYTASPHFTEAELLAALAESGVTVLDDETVLLNGELWLAGRADAGHGAERKATAALLEGADADDFILLIDHQPVGFEENIAAGVDLQLSGHTHNGQIWPVAHIIELFKTADLVYGHRQTGEFHAVVSSGIVGWGYPIRTQGHSEYVVVEIRPQA